MISITPSYGVVNLKGGMSDLRKLFPDGKNSVSEMNFIVFSTSGAHGSYSTIEEIEDSLKNCTDEDDRQSHLTFVAISPRVVFMRYGECIPETPEDFSFLKELRKASWDVMKEIGA